LALSCFLNENKLISIHQDERNWKIVSLLNAIQEIDRSLDLNGLRDRMLSIEFLMEIMKEGKENGFIKYEIIENLGLVDRILGYLGIPRKPK